jgi:hypothetical protein
MLYSLPVLLISRDSAIGSRSRAVMFTPRDRNDQPRLENKTEWNGRTDLANTPVRTSSNYLTTFAAAMSSSNSVTSAALRGVSRS